jgi:hypothetical protein
MKIKTTAHTCGGPMFGRKTVGCPRCDEMLAGAAPVVWTKSKANRPALGVRAHDCRVSQCSVVCTYGEW